DDVAAAAAAPVVRERAPGGPFREADHLEKGLMTLGRLTVAGQVKIRYGTVVGEIFAEAETGDHDLIVIGAPPPEARAPTRAGALPNDIAHAIVTAAKLPVLMVPMRAM